ncbi:MAG: substrate-binding domain-containing protein [Paracoccaceae bacterium]
MRLIHRLSPHRLLQGLILALLPLPALAQEAVRLAITTSFENSGLAAVLMPEVEAQTGLRIDLLVVGTGQALRLAQAGDVDAVIVHAPQAEAAFVAAGHATHRRAIMANDFLIAGPASDPAGLAGEVDADAALSAIAAAGTPFVSRGDDSGTHRKELSLWADAGLTPDGFGPWYRAVGAGMGAALNAAAGMGAYVLTDRGSWLAFEARGDLIALSQGDPRLANPYGYLPVNPARHAHVDAARTRAIEAALTSPAARAIIDGHRVGGQRLFTAARD